MLLSVLMALFASYAAMDIFGRIAIAKGRQRVLWLVGAALAMAGGVWALHFIGMLSMDFGIPVSYQIAGTLASFLIILVATVTSFHFVCRDRVSFLQLMNGGLALGAGVAGMHLTGLGAMELEAEVSRPWQVFVPAAAVTVAAITGALWTMTHSSFQRRKAIAAAILAVSIGGIHYVDTMSLTITILGTPIDGDQAELSRGILAVLIAFGAGIILTIVLISAVFDRRLSLAETDALRQSEERFRVMAEALPISMAVTRVEDKQVVYSNQRSVELFKVPEDPAKRESASRRYVNSEDREKVSKAVAEHGFVDNFETKMRKYDGSEFWALISAKRTPSMEGDMIVSGYYDITDRKTVEEELERKEEALRRSNADLQRAFSDLNKHAAEIEDALQRARAADQATRAKSTFLATMSHEIRTPMNGVLGLLELLAGTDLNDDQVSTVQTINESAKSMLSLIDDILDFSKIEAGKMDIEDAELDVVNMIEGIGTMTIVNARKKNLSVQVFIDPDIPSFIIGDEARLRQILNNLVSNALKFTEQGGIHIHATSEKRTGSKVWLRLDVEDTGIGISDKNRQALFEPFAQAELSTTRKYGGTGLGLAITDRLTSLLGGTISVESKVGEGSTFTVRVPVQVSASVDQPAKNQGKFSDHLAIMVTGSVRKPLLANRYLSWLGFNFEIAATTERAEQIISGAQTKTPHLIILASDGAGEDMTGKIELLRRKFDPDQLKILAVFTHTDAAEATDLSSFEGVALITQPVLRTAFMNGIAGVMSGETVSATAPDGAVKKEVHRKPPQDRETALASGRLILVAEDHETNRMVIKRQLGRLGYTADVVCDGKQALDAIIETDYGLLLTDCHMPEMDGMELTASVRQLADSKKAGMPIVAITANALSGEEERCLAAGMDDYLSKPVSLDQLSKTLGKWLTDGEDVPNREQSPDQMSAEQPRAAESDTAPPAIDRQVLADLVGDDEEAIRDLLESFIRNALASYDDLKSACHSQDNDEFESAAHKLSGSAKTAGAHGIVTALENLRQSAHQSNWSHVDSNMQYLDAAISGAQNYLEHA